MKRKQKDTIMLTIDSSTKKTGICVWKNAVYKEHLLVNYDPAEVKDIECSKMADRFPLMSHDILAILNKYKPQIIYIEDEVVARNMDTCRFLFRLQGVIEGWALEHDCEFNTVRPSEWRAVCFNQGNKKRKELKALAIAYVKEHYGLDVTDDEADAICIGVYAKSLFGIKE